MKRRDAHEDDGRGRGRFGWLRERTATLRDAPLMERIVSQLVHVNVLDIATRLAAQTFLTAVPVLLVVGSLMPSEVRRELTASARGVLGLHGSSLDEVSRLVHAGTQAGASSFGAVGVLVTLLSATSCSRVLQRLCERSWHLPHLGSRLAAWRWVVWLLVWLAALLLQSWIRSGLGVGPVLGFFLYLLVASALWCWTQHLLLGNRVPWRPLLPGAVLAGAGVLTMALVSRIYMPRALDRSIADFGPLGLVFAVFSWLIVVFVVVTVAIAVGYVLADHGRLTRLLHTPETPGPAAPAVAPRWSPVAGDARSASAEPGCSQARARPPHA